MSSGDGYGEELAPIFGGYVNSRLTAFVAQAVSRYIEKSDLRPAAERRAKKILAALERAIDPQNGDQVWLTVSKDLPDGARAARQEELAHQWIERSGLNNILKREDFLNHPAIQEGLQTREIAEKYSDMDKWQQANELIAKTLRDGAAETLELPQEKIDNIINLLLDIAKNEGYDLTALADTLENISPKGKEFADYAKQRTRNKLDNRYNEEPFSDSANQTRNPAKSSAALRERSNEQGAANADGRNDRIARFRQGSLYQENDGIKQSGAEAGEEEKVSFQRADDADADAAREMQKAVSLVEKYLYDGKRDVPLAVAGVNMARAGVLMASTVIKTNVVGNSLHTAGEVLSQPFAALTDLMLANFTNKTKGRRSLIWARLSSVPFIRNGWRRL